MADCILFITSDKSWFDKELQSADNIDNAFDVIIEVSPSIPAEFVICAMAALKFITFVKSSPRLCVI